MEVQRHNETKELVGSLRAEIARVIGLSVREKERYI